jgi:hypothetical protein
MSEIFISYKREDHARVAPLVAALVQAGFSVWWDSQINPGDNWMVRIVSEIELSKLTLGIWSGASVDEKGLFKPNNGGKYYVQIEHDLTIPPRVLVPVVFDDGKIPLEYKHVQAQNLSGWTGDAADERISRLLAHIGALIGAGGSGSAHIAETAHDGAEGSAGEIAFDVSSGAEEARFLSISGTIARAALASCSGYYLDVAMPNVLEKFDGLFWETAPHWADNGAGLIGHCPAPDIFDAYTHLSIYFMSQNADGDSFKALGVAMRALKACSTPDFPLLTKAMASVCAKMIVNALRHPNNWVAHYALGRWLGASTKILSQSMPGASYDTWLECAALVLDILKSRELLSSGFYEFFGSNLDAQRAALPKWKGTRLMEILKLQGDFDLFRSIEILASEHRA